MKTHCHGNIPWYIGQEKARSQKANKEGSILFFLNLLWIR